MLLEDLLLAGAIGLVAAFAVLPLVRAVAGRPWRKRDPLAEARERLRVAKLDAEAARLHREAERIYEDLYRETLADADDARAATSATDEAPAGESAPGKKGN